MNLPITKRITGQLTTANKLKSYIEEATSDNTRKAYQSDLRHYQQWGGQLPASPRDIMHYLSDHAESLNSRTLERRITALRQWHLFQGLTNPCAAPEIKKVLKGIKRLHGVALQKAPALDFEELAEIAKWLASDKSLGAKRDLALLLVGFFGAFRRSELVGIEVEHLNWQREGLEILIPASKTDTTREGQYCVLPYGVNANHVLCPLFALNAWLEAAAITTGPVFRRITRNKQIGLRRLSDISVSRILKSVAAEAGIEKAPLLSGHSLRRGLATSASQKNISLEDIMRQGRWKKAATVMGYIEERDRFKRNVLTQLMED